MRITLFPAVTFCVIFAFAKSGETGDGTANAHLSNAYVFQVPYRQQTIYGINTQDSVQLRNGEKMMFVFPPNGHQQSLSQGPERSKSSFEGTGDKISASDSVYSSAQSTGVISRSSHDNIKSASTTTGNLQHNDQSTGTIIGNLQNNDQFTRASIGSSYDNAKSTGITTGSLKTNGQSIGNIGGSLYGNVQSTGVIAGSSYDNAPSASVIGGRLYNNDQSTGGPSSYSNSQFTDDRGGSHDNAQDSSSSGTIQSPNYALTQGEKYNTRDSARNFPSIQSIYSQADSTNTFSNEKQFSHPSTEINLNVKKAKSAKKIPLVMITIQNKHNPATFDDTANIGQSNHSQPLDQTVLDSNLGKQNEYSSESQDKSSLQRLPEEGPEWKPLEKTSYSIQKQGQAGKIFLPISTAYQVHNNQAPTADIGKSPGKAISQQSTIPSPNLGYGYQQFRSIQPSNTHGLQSYHQTAVGQSPTVPKSNLQLPAYGHSSSSHTPNTYLRPESARNTGSSNVAQTSTNYGQTYSNATQKSKSNTLLQKHATENIKFHNSNPQTAYTHEEARQASGIQSQPRPLNDSYKYGRHSFQNHQYSGLVQNTVTPRNIQQQSVYTFNAPIKTTEVGQLPSSQSYGNPQTATLAETSYQSSNQIKPSNTDPRFYNSFPNVQNREQDTQREKTTYEQSRSRFLDNQSQQAENYGNSNSANSQNSRENGKDLRRSYLKKQADFLLQNSYHHSNIRQEYDDKRNKPQNQDFTGDSTYRNVRPPLTQNIYGSNQWQATSTNQGHGHFQEPREQTFAAPQFFKTNNKQTSTHDQDSTLTLSQTSGDQRVSDNYSPQHQQPTNFENGGQVSSEDNSAARQRSTQESYDFNRQEFRNQEVQRPATPSNYGSNSNYDISFAPRAYATEPQASGTDTKSQSDSYSENSANDYEIQKLSPEALLLVLVSTQKGGVREQIMFEDNYGQGSEIIEFASPNLRNSEVLNNLRKAVENSQFSRELQNDVTNNQSSTKRGNSDY